MTNDNVYATINIVSELRHYIVQLGLASAWLYCFKRGMIKTLKSMNNNDMSINLSGYSTVHPTSSASVIQERRLVLELTQKQVAEKARIPLSTYQKFENGERNIRTAAFEVTCRVMEALEMNIIDFFHGLYSIGEEVYIDSDGQKYVKTGRLVTEDIDDAEAVNVLRIHIFNNSLVIPLKILRAMNKPDLMQLMYHQNDKRLGFRVMSEISENTVIIPKDVYSGRWRGIRIDDNEFIDLVYSIIGRNKGNYLAEPVFFEQGCILPLNEMVKSDYQIKEKDYYLLSLER